MSSLKTRFVFVIASALFLTSCATVYTKDAVEYHMINIDKDGKYTPAPPNVRFDPDAGKDDPKFYKQYLDQLFMRINDNSQSAYQASEPKRRPSVPSGVAGHPRARHSAPASMAGAPPEPEGFRPKRRRSMPSGVPEPEGFRPKRILIYVHGGLNMYHNSIKKVVELHDDIGDGDFYPIFINWRSFFFTTYGEHLGRIRQGQPSRLAPFTAPLYFMTDLLSAVVRGPRALSVQGGHILNTLRERTVKFPETIISTMQIIQHPIKSLIQHPIQDVTPKAKHPYIHYIKRNTKPRHAKLKNQIWYWVTMPGTWILNPFVSEIGRPSWDMMRRRNSVLFRTPAEYEQDECTPGSGRTTTSEGSEQCYRGTGALSVFLQRLDREMQAERGNGRTSGSPKYTVTLVGHSMGTIVVNQILGDFPDIHFDNVVFMAAAVSTREVLEHTIPYLKEHPTTQFYSLSLAPDNDNSETSLIGVEPSGSLLTWIDNYYTTPLTQLDRTFGRWENARSALHVFPPEILEEQMHFKVFGFNGRNSPQEHGEFTNYPFWMPNFWWKGSWEYGDYSHEASEGELDTSYLKQPDVHHL